MKSSRCSFPRTQHDECNFLLLSDHAPSHVVQQAVCLVCRESDCSLTFTLAPTATPGLWQQDCCLDSFLPVCSNARHNHNPDTEWVRRKLKDDSITMGGSSLISLIRLCLSFCTEIQPFSLSAAHVPPAFWPGLDSWSKVKQQEASYVHYSDSGRVTLQEFFYPLQSTFAYHLLWFWHLNASKYFNSHVSWDYFCSWNFRSHKDWVGRACRADPGARKGKYHLPIRNVAKSQVYCFCPTMQNVRLYQASLRESL